MLVYTKEELTRKLNTLVIGKSIAELDDQLNDSFVESSSLFDFISDRYDVIRGAKGTGKSALLLYVFNNQSLFQQLENVILVKANEHSGAPAFKKAFGSLTAQDSIEVYSVAWKIYIINLIYNEVKSSLSFDSELEKYLKSKKIITAEKTFLSRLMFAVLKAKATVTHNDVEYGLQMGEIDVSEHLIDFNYVFSAFQRELENEDIKVWVLLDRLDDAFPDWTAESLIALKSLFYVYKDLLGLQNIKLKTFVRNDIFDKIAENGFTSLSHILPITSAPLVWDEVKIRAFILNRFKNYIDIADSQTATEKILGKQIDVGKKQPDSFGWLLNHLKDGSQTFTPRDVLEYLDSARQHTLTDLSNNVNIQFDSEFFTKSSLKLAWKTVSQSKYETQLCAENPELKQYFDFFSERKSEYTATQLQSFWGEKYLEVCQQLVYVGFFEKRTDSWKIPFLYRPCLNIKQGKM